MNSDSALAPWLAHARELVPGIELFDAHTHIGQNDPDGFKQTPDQLMTALGEAGAIGCFVFPMHEPDGYPAANDIVLEVAAAQDAKRAAGTGAGRDADPATVPRTELVPFCRVDPNADPIAEAERCLARGARGIKLHPRAEQFGLDHPQVERLFALADEHRLPVLIHAGRGIPALGANLTNYAARYPNARAILAHAAVSDLSWLWKEAAGLPNLLFDSSWWIPTDLIALYTLVPPGQILFASDVPYGHPGIAAASQVRLALQAGLTPGQVRLVMSGQALNVARGGKLADGGAAVDERRTRSHVLLERVSALLQTGTLLLFRGAEGSAEVLSLARLAMEVPDGIEDAPVFAALRTLMAQFDVAVAEQPGERAPLGLLTLAAVIARTPDVPLPDGV